MHFTECNFVPEKRSIQQDFLSLKYPGPDNEMSVWELGQVLLHEIGALLALTQQLEPNES